MFKTELTERLGIQYPIIQAGMGGVAMADLVAAVSNAGGLGVIGAAMLTPAELREEIRRVKDKTDKPFGVDILLAQGWLGQEETVEVIIDEGVPVFVSGLGNPAPYVEAMHRAGMTVIAQGTEGGGHTGQIATMALLPQVVDAVAPKPVVAAGGIADGRGLVAALALGACGVWVGTRFVATREAYAHDSYKRKILEANEEATIVTRAFTGKDCRVLRNAYAEAWENRKAEIKPFPLQMMVDGEKMTAAMREGNTDLGLMPTGQICGAINEVKSAAEVVREMIEEADEVLRRLAQRHLELQAAR